MANYLKGIGDAGTGVNEIPPSLDARINKFLMGHISGVIKSEFNEFNAAKIDRGVIISSGLCQAQGYFGCADTETVVNFIMPNSTNYVQIFAEIDLSVLPNRFEIKASAMSNSTAYAFRQDNLRAMVNGKYQLPLWQVTLTSTSITLKDRRAFIAKPSDALHADEADHANRADNAATAGTAGTCTGNAGSATRVNDQISSTTAVEFYVGSKKVRIEA